ncbi:MAG: hypothetical protein ACFCBU_15575 [Cyanophyceae cyanobacterium]
MLTKISPTLMSSDRPPQIAVAVYRYGDRQSGALPPNPRQRDTAPLESLALCDVFGDGEAVH